MNELILEIFREFSKRTEFRMVAEKTSCLLIHQDNQFVIKSEWCNHWSTNGSINIYCLIAESVIQDVNQLEDASYHQYGIRVVPLSWVWLPRLDISWPTSYRLRFLLSKKQYFWKIARVGKGNDSASSERMGRKIFKENLVQELTAFLPKLEPKLSEAIKRDARNFKVGDRLALLHDWGQGMKLGEAVTVKAILQNDRVSVNFDRFPEVEYDVWAPYVDYIAE